MVREQAVASWDRWGGGVIFGGVMGESGGGGVGVRSKKPTKTETP